MVRFVDEHGALATRALLHAVGHMPIPPYIRRGISDEQDRADYQTFFAANDGSIAAPTASLHFTPELFERIRARGAAVRFLTLHVGAASFLPLWHGDEDELRKPGAERFYYDPTVLTDCAAARARGGRVIAVGTTVVRALESHAAHAHKGGDKSATLLSTELFITPGYQFALVDALVTNFHQPRTTHLLLVESLLGRARLQRVYEYALAHDFRFLSYGDGMFITGRFPPQTAV